MTSDNSPAASDATTTLHYTAYGAVDMTTDPDGVVTHFGYDPAHRLTDITDSLGKHIHYTLDAAGNTTKEETFTAAGATVRRVTQGYNTLGQLTSVLDGLNHTVFGAGDSDSYDGNGNLVHSTDGLGVQQKNGYDALNRLVSTIQNHNGTDSATSSSTTGVSFDALDRPDGIVDPDGLATYPGYDGLSNRTRLQSPDTGTSTDTFDAAGNRLTHTDAKGIVSTSTYDALNRRIGTSYADSTLNVSYDYDEANTVTGCSSSQPIGRLTRVVENAVTTSYCYGGHGNLVQKRQIVAGHTDLTQYAYTHADRLSGITTPDGTVISYGLNTNNGGISSVQVTPSGSGAALTTIASAINWLPFGPRSNYTLGNGQTVTLGYDLNYRVTDLTSPALNLHFARDVMGDITAIGNAAGASPATETYHYDPLYRLKDATASDSSVLEGYSYTKTGDRLSKTASGLATGSYLYTTGTHQLASVGGFARSSDANGNTTNTAVGAETFVFGYNGRNRMASAQRDGSTVATYTYNAMGERIGKAATFPQAVTERYAYDEAGHLIGEYGTTNRDYVWMDDIPVAVIDNTAVGSVTTSTVSYVTADQLGTPRAVTNGAGTTIWAWAYQGNPFGERQPTSTSGYVLNLRYPGQYYDAETGTNYNMFRTYEAATGRYLQSDPIGLQGDISTYAYVGGNPLSYTDPLGLWEWPSLPQGFVNASAGFGDALSFGLTGLARNGLGIGSVDECSGSYKGGQAAGIVAGFIDGEGEAELAVSIGKNENQISHAFRYVDNLGLDRGAVTDAIQSQLSTARDEIVPGLNKFSTEIDGVGVDYHAYQLPDGSVNVGRITPRGN
ncbi:MAG TPA: RHS repeat-associated core domain-containing protein [Rhodanobacter sp.]